jgi:integrase
MAKDKNGKELPKGIVLRSDGRYMGRFRYNQEDYTVYDYDLKTAVRKLSDLRYEVEHGIYAKESDISLNDWFAIWLKDFKMKSVRPGTQEVYKNIYSGCIKKSLGKRKIKDIRLEHIQRLYNRMSENYAEGTIRLANVVLYGLFEQAMKNQLITSNPVRLATIPKARKRQQRKVLTLEEQKLFLSYAQKHSRAYPLFAFALLTGCRNGEVRGLMWSDVDFENRIIHVTGTLKYVKGLGIFKGPPKSDSGHRDVPMLEVCYKLLKQHQEEQKAKAELIGELWKPLSGLENLVFTQDNGIPVSREILTAEMKMINNKLREDGYEIEDFTFHSFRHTFATRALESDISMKTTQTILGHAQYAVTADLYSHVLPNTKAKEMEKMAHLFEDSDKEVKTEPGT